MSEFKIGIPTKSRTVKVEKYPNTPVFTMFGLPTEGARTYKFSLNKKALEVLGNPTHVSVATKDRVYLTNTSSNDEVQRFKLTQKGEISSGPLHKYLSKKFDLTSGEFELVQSNESSAFFALNMIANGISSGNSSVMATNLGTSPLIMENPFPTVDDEPISGEAEQVINEIVDPVNANKLF